MDGSNIIISQNGLEVTLCPPSFQDGYYRGVRFDHSGIFRRIEKDGFVFADEWFDVHDPYKHDAVCGASEEFSQCGYEYAQVGEVFLKPGVGLLVKDSDTAYDHFKLYEVADCGRWTVTSEEDSATFIHVLDAEGWGYVYEKEVRLISGECMQIAHRLCNTGPKLIKGETYNHNFFTFGDARPGPEMQIDFPFRPCGKWRSDYDSVALVESGIRYFRHIRAGESVFMGNLDSSEGEKNVGQVYSMHAASHQVIFETDLPFSHIEFWSNHRVGCIEPFIPYELGQGDELQWTYRYCFL